MMIITALAIGSFSTALLLLLLSVEDPLSGRFEEWINNDGFKQETLDDDSKRALIMELVKLKQNFRIYLNDSNELFDESGNPMTPLRTTDSISDKMRQIDKLRLVIQHDLSIVKNLHKPSGVNYVVARAYWLDDKGKKFRKFAKNIGSEEKVMENGKIPAWRIEQVEREIDKMMLNQYREEYP